MVKQDTSTLSTPTTDTDTEAPKRVGRPRKSEVQTKKPGNRGKPGRPKGDAAIINEYKARMLASPKSVKVLGKIYDAALDDNHKHQAAAWKLIVDRIVPQSAFENDLKKGGGKPQVTINISSTESQGVTIEGEQVGETEEGDVESDDE